MFVRVAKMISGLKNAYICDVVETLTWNFFSI